MGQAVHEADPWSPPAHRGAFTALFYARTMSLLQWSLAAVHPSHTRVLNCRSQGYPTAQHAESRRGLLPCFHRSRVVDLNRGGPAGPAPEELRVNSQAQCRLGSDEQIGRLGRSYINQIRINRQLYCELVDSGLADTLGSASETPWRVLYSLRDRLRCHAPRQRGGRAEEMGRRLRDS
jgi:hypothetical protein